jgi:hypothetical protein
MTDYQSLTDDDLRSVLNERWSVAKRTGDARALKQWGELVVLHGTEFPRKKVIRLLLIDDDDRTDLDPVPLSRFGNVAELPVGAEKISIGQAIRTLNSIESELEDRTRPYSQGTRVTRFRLNCLLTRYGVAPRWRGLTTPERRPESKMEREKRIDGWLIDWEWLAYRREHAWLDPSAMDGLVRSSSRWRELIEEGFDLGLAEDVVRVQLGSSPPKGRYRIKLDGALAWETHAIRTVERFKDQVRSMKRREERALEIIQRHARRTGWVTEDDVSNRLTWWRAGLLGYWRPQATATWFRLMTGAERSRQRASQMLKLLEKIDKKLKPRVSGLAPTMSV